MPKKSTGLYRTLLAESWTLTWQRKALWIFGIFAALISTGGVIDVVFSALKKIEGRSLGLEQFLDSSFIGYEIAAQYIAQLQLLGAGRVGALITAATIIGIVLLIIAVLSQGALILGAKTKKPKDPYTLKREAGEHFWSLLLVGILNKIAMAILTMLMTLPLFFFFVQTSTYSALLFFLSTLIFLPSLVIVNIIYMFALIHIVDKNARAIDAIITSTRLFQKQWVSTFEYGLILFFLVFGVGTILIVLLALLTVPYAIVFTATLLTGSFSLFLTVNVVFSIMVIALIITFGGAMVTFQYSAWYLFYKRGVHRLHGKRVFSKLLRWAHK